MKKLYNIYNYIQDYFHVNCHCADHSVKKERQMVGSVVNLSNMVGGCINFPLTKALNSARLLFDLIYFMTKGTTYGERFSVMAEIECNCGIANWCITQCMFDNIYCAGNFRGKTTLV